MRKLTIWPFLIFAISHILHFSYSPWVNLWHSATVFAIVSFQIPHALYFIDIPPCSYFLKLFVLNTWSWAAIIRLSNALFQLSMSFIQAQVFLPNAFSVDFQNWTCERCSSVYLICFLWIPYMPFSPILFFIAYSLFTVFNNFSVLFCKYSCRLFFSFHVYTLTISQQWS